MKRVLVTIVLASTLLTPGCLGESSDRVTPSARNLPLTAADPINDYLPARKAAVALMPAGVSAGDLRVVSDRPEVPNAWSASHGDRPYKMVHLRLEAGGASPGAFDAWPVQAREGEPWTCEIVVSRD